MRPRRIASLAVWALLHLLILSDASRASVSPAAVGWGGLLVPGLGATLLGEAGRGALEAASESGLYFGGAFGNRESAFTIDGSVEVPVGAGISRALLGQAMQEFGLKLHMYDTFYNYQQAARAVADSDRERGNPQPLYQGDWKDMLSAPFRWQNLGSPWVYPLIIVTSIALVYDYHSTSLSNHGFAASSYEQAFYGLNQMATIPLGGALGEEALFRGFVQREARLYTRSVPLSLLWQSSMFTLVHPDSEKISAFLSGLYFGMMTNHYDGNLEPAIAAHFWVNVVSGLTTYWAYARAQGKDTPFAPPLGMQLRIPF
jgi:membrane protease YdiL (CAAX protease family)